MGRVHYTVYGDGKPYEISVRDKAPSEYELSIANGDKVRDQFWSEVGRLVLVRGRRLKDGTFTFEVTPECLQEFNEFRQARHAEWMQQWAAHPEKYGEVDLSDPLAVPPAILKGGRLQDHYFVDVA